MNITFDATFGVLLIVISHTIITHLFNWAARKVCEINITIIETIIYFLLIGLLHLVELIAIYAFLTNNYLH